MKKKVLFLGIILAVFLLTGCSINKQPSGKIVSFSYNYGSYNGGYYDYKIKKEDNIVKYTATGSNGVTLNEDKVIDETYLSELENIIEKNKIKKWNGFNKSDSGVLDGYSFSLNVEYENGDKITAHGYMKKPFNYKKGHNALIEFFKTIK